MPNVQFREIWKVTWKALLMIVLPLFIIAAFLVMVLVGLYQSETATGLLLTVGLLIIVAYFIIYVY